MKICPQHSPLGPGAFADYYAFAASAGTPLVVFLGDALPLDGHEAARRIEPAQARDAFAPLARAVPVRLLVVPTPPDFAGSAPFALPLFSRHLDEEILPRVAAPDTTLALVGAGLGAFFACGFAVRSARVAAIATLGGPRLAKALGEPLPASLPPIACFANLDDPLRRYADDLYAILWARGHCAALQHRPGGQAFGEYVANGSLAEAFRFAVELVNRPLRHLSSLDRPA